MGVGSLSSLIKQQPQGCKYSLALVDGKNLFYRSFFGHGHGNMGDYPGVFGTLSFLCEVIQALGRDCLTVVCWDYGVDPERLALFPGYKDRPRKPGIDYEKMGLDLEETLRLSRLLPVFTSYPVVGAAEADDLIFTAVEDFKVQEPQGSCCILSDDSDFVQLVTPNCHLYTPRKKQLHTPATAALYSGCPPDRYLFMKALRGDDTDTIPGVPGVGKVAAPLLVEYYASLEEMEKDPNLCKAPRMGRKPQLVLGHSDIVLRNLKLIALKRVEYDLHWGPDPDTLSEDVKDLGYVSIRQKIRSVFD